MAFGDSLTRREQTFVGIGLLSLLAAAGFWYFVHGPRNEELMVLEARLERIEANNRRARADMAKGSVAELRAELERDQQTLHVMRTLVPTSNEVPALLEDISTAARRVGLDLASVEPMPVIAGEEFDTYRYKLSVIGHYHAIGQFLTNVGSLRRIVAPVTLDLKPQTAQGRQMQRVRDNPERPRLETSFQVQTYVSRALPTETMASEHSAENSAVSSLDDDTEEPN
jgi:type IV pilus assembly protein PilO